jgi:hypothetical protein
MLTVVAQGGTSEVSSTRALLLSAAYLAAAGIAAAIWFDRRDVTA